VIFVVLGAFFLLAVGLVGVAAIAVGGLMAWVQVQGNVEGWGAAGE
jgi:hypothetical protein